MPTTKCHDLTKLSLNSTDPAHDVSIRLKPGQFCTLGSSSAADYCVRAVGILPMHCRIGCRQTGGFIECLDPSATINIAGTDKNRSRLTNGDQLKIGTLPITVVIPQASKSAPSFGIAFDDIDSAEPAETARNAQATAERLDEGTHSQPVEREQEESAAADARTDLDNSPIEQSEASLSKVPNSDDNQSVADSKKVTSSTGESKNLDSTKSGKPIFEFDSVEPSDIKLTEEDLDVIENMTGNSLVLQDFDTMGTETFPEHLRQESLPSKADDGQPSATELEPDSDDHVPSGSDTGKCYRWTSTSVMPMIELLEQRISGIRCFDIQKNVNLVPCSFTEIKQAVANKDGPKIFVLSNNNQDELRGFFAAKRWNERLGHPQALSMFLTLLPARNIQLLFEEIDACILVQKSDIELVRLSRGLKK